MAADNNAVLQASVTKTASFNGASFSLPTGTPRRGLNVRVLYSAATNASGSNSVTFSIEQTTDGTNWYRRTDGALEVVNLSTTAQAGEFVLPIAASPGVIAIRLVATVAGAGSTPTITYQGDLVTGRP